VVKLSKRIKWAKYPRLAAALIFMVLLGAACSKATPTPTAPSVPAATRTATAVPGTPISQLATVEIRVTDKPPEGVTKILLTVQNIEVNVAQAGTESGWKTIIPGPTEFDLVAVTGVEGVLGSTQLPPGRYSQLRMEVVKAMVTIQNVARPATVPSGKLRFVGEFDLVAGQTAVLTLDFDAERSIVLRGSQDPLLKPVVKLLVRKGGQPLAAAETVSNEPVATPTTVPGATPTTVPGATPTTVPGATPTTVPAPTPTTVPGATPTTVPAPTPTPVPAPTRTLVPTATPTTVPAPTPTLVPGATATPSPVPTLITVPAPTATPVPGATLTPTPVPTPTPTPVPGATPTATAVPAATPTPVPGATPTATTVPGATPTPSPTPLAGRAPIALGSAGNFVILTKTGISTTGTTSIVGDIGVSPIDSTGITGFGLIADSSNTFSTSSLVTGRVYAANYTAPTPSNMTTAVSAMETAYTDAAGRTTPDFTELGTGNISGMTLTPGLYKWGTEVTITSGVTLTGGANAVWIFQIAGNLTVGNGAIVTLSGGAQAQNIFWQVAGQTTLGTTSQFKGIILCQTLIAMNTGATLDGRALAQTAVTLNANAVTKPN